MMPERKKKNLIFFTGRELECKKIPYWKRIRMVYKATNSKLHPIKGTTWQGS